MIADARQSRHHHPQRIKSLGALIGVDRILGLQMQIMQVRQYTQHRLAGMRFQPVQAGLQQRDIAAKTIDDKALDPRLLALREQCQRTDQVGKHPALVDVGNQNHRAIHRFGKAHVGDITRAQIDLCRRACTLDHYGVVAGEQTLVRRQHRAQRRGLVSVVSHCIHAADRMTMNNHLGAHIGIGFEQHRIHIGMRLQVRGLGLHRLGAADLTAINRHRRVQCHILWFERHYLDVLMTQPTAQGGDQRTLAGIRGGALNHQRAHASALAGVLRPICANAVLSRCQADSLPGRPMRNAAGWSNNLSRMPWRAGEQIGQTLGVTPQTCPPQGLRGVIGQHSLANGPCGAADAPGPELPLQCNQHSRFA